jgi:hypothetical protein
LPPHSWRSVPAGTALTSLPQARTGRQGPSGMQTATRVAPPPPIDFSPQALPQQQAPQGGPSRHRRACQANRTQTMTTAVGEGGPDMTPSGPKEGLPRSRVRVASRCCDPSRHRAAPLERLSRSGAASPLIASCNALIFSWK